MPDKKTDNNKIESFLDRFSYQIFQFCTSEDLLLEGDRILVSISGGLDSVGLFRLLYSFRLKIRMELHLVHFHHGLRQESDEEEIFIRNLSADFKVPVTVLRTDSLRNQKGLQEKARKWRYEQLTVLLNELGFNKIALGHHLDDLVETQIWKLTRGTSLFGLNPIQSKNHPYIRPLLQTSKEELRSYLKHIGQEWREDLSNQKSDYTRNLIRNQIIPLLDESAGGSLSRKMLSISQDATFLNEYFEQLFQPETYQGESLHYDQIRLHNNKLLACELIHRFLLFHQQFEINRDNLERIYDLVLQGRGNWAISLKNNATVTGLNKELRIEREGLI